MTRLIIAAFILSVFALGAPGQMRSDSSGKASDTTTTAGPHQKRMGQKFVDENGDGIDDRLQGRGKGMRRGKDRFIDQDGDGICDDRASGLGFRRGAGGSTGYMGGDRDGKRKRQGGKP